MILQLVGVLVGAVGDDEKADWVLLTLAAMLFGVAAFVPVLAPVSFLSPVPLAVQRLRGGALAGWLSTALATALIAAAQKAANDSARAPGLQRPAAGAPEAEREAVFTDSAREAAGLVEDPRLRSLIR